MASAPGAVRNVSYIGDILRDIRETSGFVFLKPVGEEQHVSTTEEGYYCIKQDKIKEISEGVSTIEEGYKAIFVIKYPISESCVEKFKSDHNIRLGLSAQVHAIGYIFEQSKPSSEHPYLVYDFFRGNTLYQHLDVLSKNHERVPPALVWHICNCLVARVKGIRFEFPSPSARARIPTIVHNDINPRTVVLDFGDLTSSLPDIKLAGFDKAIIKPDSRNQSALLDFYNHISNDYNAIGTLFHDLAHEKHLKGQGAWQWRPLQNGNECHCQPKPNMGEPPFFDREKDPSHFWSCLMRSDAANAFDERDFTRKFKDNLKRRQEKAGQYQPSSPPMAHDMRDLSKHVISEDIIKDFVSRTLPAVPET